MFDAKQTAIIKRALTEYDGLEAKALVGDEQVKYQFTNHFEEQAEAIRKRVFISVKRSAKRVLLIAAVLAMVLSVTVAMFAGDKDMHVIRFGNDIDITQSGGPADPMYLTPGIMGDGVLDIPAMIIESELPIPEGYECNYFDPLRKSSYNISYSKPSEKAAYRHAYLSINIYEIYENTGVRLDHNGEMLVLEMGDLKVYHYGNEYLMKGRNYAATIHCNDPDMTNDQILAIYEAIDNMMTAPMRSEEEIEAEMEEEPPIAVHTGQSEFSDWDEYNLDFSVIKYRTLDLPEGYKLTKNTVNIATKYQKFDENRQWMSTMEIEMIDLTVDPFIASLYENPGMAHEFEDITVYSRAVGYMEDYLSVAMEYVFVDERYAVVFYCEASGWIEGAAVPTPEEIADLARQIRGYMMGV